MTHIKILAERCISSGNCVDVAPQTFDMDDAGLVVALVDEVDNGAREQVEAAVQVCPVQAILLEG